jgi:hypothetical protein
MKLTLPDEANDPFEFFPRAEDLPVEFAEQLMALAESDKIPNRLREMCKRVSMSEETIADTWALMRATVREYSHSTLPLHEIVVRMMASTSSLYTGVVCLSARPDDITMWSHYAANHTGIAIGLDPLGLSGVVDVWAFAPVMYCRTRPKVPSKAFASREEGFSAMRTTFLTKSLEWAYEREWRMLINLKSPDVSQK